MSAWLSAFLLTQIVEVPIYVHALTREQPERVFERWQAALLVAFAASTITHPIVWFVMPRLIPSSYLLMVAVAEGFAVLAEAVWLRGFGLRRALWCALFSNAARVLVGLVLRRTFGWP